MKDSPKVPRRKAAGQVAIFKGRGYVLVSPRQSPATGKRQGGGRRGKVLKWSGPSRRRFRHALLTLAPPDGWSVVGITLTVPGPLLPVETYKGLWTWYCRELERAGYGLIWRVEVQARGALHWHGIGIGPGRAVRVGEAFRELWWDAVRRLGPFSYDPPYYGGKGEWASGITAVESLMGMPGAYEFSAHVQTNEGHGWRGAWLRYLQDHASKAKQEQIAEGMRHWGIVGRKRFKRVTPSDAYGLTERQWWALLRRVQRLSTPSIPDGKSPFGRRLGFRTRRGSGHGASVWFGRPETLLRLVDWAMGQFPREAE